MPDHQNVVVYIPARHARRLRALGLDPATWVRALVRRELAAQEITHQHLAAQPQRPSKRRDGDGLS